MNIKTYFNDRFLNALSRDDVLGGHIPYYIMTLGNARDDLYIGCGRQ
ncbi:hypothetical protein [Prevotella histicola]|nr:hypothetical protein [Prevotella histicola]